MIRSILFLKCIPYVLCLDKFYIISFNGIETSKENTHGIYVLYNYWNEDCC